MKGAQGRVSFNQKRKKKSPESLPQPGEKWTGAPGRSPEERALLRLLRARRVGQHEETGSNRCVCPLPWVSGACARERLTQPPAGALAPPRCCAAPAPHPRPPALALHAPDPSHRGGAAAAPVPACH